MKEFSFNRKLFSGYSDEQVLFLRDSLKEVLHVFKLGDYFYKNNIVLNSFRETFQDSLEGLNLEAEKRSI